MSRYRKAILAAIPAVLAVLAALGIVVPDGTSDALTAVVTSVFAALVLLVPNAR